MRRFRRWLAEHEGREFEDYDSLWRWSVDEPDVFWLAVWRYFDVQSPDAIDTVLADAGMPGARWFPGVRLNLAAEVLRHAQSGDGPAVLFESESGRDGELSWSELRRQVSAFATGLQALGVRQGDRVAAYLPNGPEAVVAFLATASIGAIWSICSPDMGPVSVLARFRQIEPRVLIACRQYRYGGKDFDCSEVVIRMTRELPALSHLIHVGPESPATGTTDDRGTEVVGFEELTATAAPEDWQPEPVPFDHPLWIVYSSGTTGVPKAIVHGHGGITLEALKTNALHIDIDPGDRFFWYCTTSWIMWNIQVSGLLVGATIALYDGNPGHPDLDVLWRFAERHRLTHFGAGAAYFQGCQKAGLVPGKRYDLSALRALGSTGSPLPAETYRWAYDAVREDIWWCVVAGGTDIAGAFFTGNPELELRDGEMQCRNLGAAVEAWNEAGEPVIDEVGELVCTRPMPSMPLFFWGDNDNARYRDAYFDHFPGVWRHGDWVRITPEGGGIIYGRSDATINRQGIRMGTAELYEAVETLPEIADSMVVDLEYLGRESWMALFVVPAEGVTLDDALRERLRERIAVALTRRHVPDEIYAVKGVPRTLTGKKMELPIKKLLLGKDPAQALNRDAMANPEVMEWYLDLARDRGPASGPQDVASASRRTSC